MHCTNIYIYRSFSSISGDSGSKSTRLITPYLWQVHRDDQSLSIEHEREAELLVRTHSRVSGQPVSRIVFYGILGRGVTEWVQ